MYTGTVPQSWVEALAEHLSKNNNGGRVMAEQMLREEYTRGPLVKLFTGGKLSADDKAALPLSITGKRLDEVLSQPNGGD